MTGSERERESAREAERGMCKPGKWIERGFPASGTISVRGMVGLVTPGSILSFVAFLVSTPSWIIVTNQTISNWMITESIGRSSKSHNSVCSYLTPPPPQLPLVILREEVGISSVILLSKTFHYSKRHLEFPPSSSKSSREYLDFSRKR